MELELCPDLSDSKVQAFSTTGWKKSPSWSPSLKPESHLKPLLSLTASRWLQLPHETLILISLTNKEIPWALPSFVPCLVIGWLPTGSFITSRSNTQRKKGDMPDSVSFLRVNKTFTKAPGKFTPHQSLWLELDTCPFLNQSLAKPLKYSAVVA